MVDCGAAADVASAVCAAVRAGVDWVQIRERTLGGADLAAFAADIAAAARRGALAAGREVRLLVNRRIDVALAIGADGVHLGFDAVDVDSARRLLGDGALVGVSIHSPEEAAAAHGASYVHLAPVFRPLSKRGTRHPLGPGAVRAASRVGLPVIAQGGIDAANAASLRAAGAAGIAVTGAILLSGDPGAVAGALRRALDGSPTP